MNRIIAIFLFLFLTNAGTSAAEFLPFAGPRPLAVMIETDPWLMVIGSDTPSFVLYEDGQVIYRNRAETKKWQYLWKQLTAEQLEKLKTQLAAFGPFRKIAPHIELVDFSDQSETKLYLHLGNTALTTSIYGMNFVASKDGIEGRPKPLPPELRKLHTFLTTLAFNGATEWVPNYVEAMASDYSYAPNASIVWPKNWPGLNSPTTITRKSGYSIFLPASELKNLSSFLATQKDKGAVEIDGKKFAVAVRSTFPSEPVWRKAFSD